MMFQNSERRQALKLAKALDCMGSEGVAGGDDAEVQSLLATARQLTRLPTLVAALDKAAAQRIYLRVVTQNQSPGRRVVGALRIALAVVTCVIICVVGLFLVVPERSALAEWFTQITLGRFAVVVTPEKRTGLQIEAVETILANWSEAQTVMSFTPMEPAVLPDGYHMQSLRAISYKGMPDWLPQPFYLDAIYAPAGKEADDEQYLSIRQYAISYEPHGEISRLGFQPQQVENITSLSVGDKPAVLVELGQGSALRELIWQHNGLAVELTSRTLSAQDLITVAESMR
jgi:hypothetical protein